MTLATTPLSALRFYWGYSSFRPLQEKIVASILGGHDACVVMPTGGGKSLCYQLPASLNPGKTAIVVSPLIALMLDQVAQLSQMGISAAYLNSSLSVAEGASLMKKAETGHYRLIYLSPERLARPDAIDWLRRTPVSFFAIDEAHCISEWGHEFRPEYRELRRLRRHFPECPIAAFTASATRQVRHDIIEQLQLREPHKYIVSFHRPNLRYIVRLCDARTQPSLLLAALRKHAQSSIIVYAPTIARVEELVEFLTQQGISAIAYHGKLDASTRRSNQELWMSDEVRVLVGTIAFGLGINKPAVRAVIHLSLPKSIEQYYQEAGRAGRDGLPADCLLLWQKKDAGLLAHFIEQITDSGEHEQAWRRYHEIRGFAESGACRHRQICAHFGENVKWKACAACDVCGCETDWLAAQPSTKKVRRHKRTDAQIQQSGRINGPSERPVAGGIEPELREELRKWRLGVAKEQGVPAFVVMHDSSLDDLCRVRPRSLQALLQVSGFGERKTELYGRQILEVVTRCSGRAATVKV